MVNFHSLGRIFFGVSIAIMGLVTAIDQAFPYMLIPPSKSWRLDISALPIFFGILLTVAGVAIIIRKQTRMISMMLGGLLMAVFVFYYIPYQFLATEYSDLKQWENAFKELDLACGALIVAALFDVPATIAFALTIVCYGIFHFQLAEGVANYVPSWIPFRLFWAYAAGAGLLASGIAIVFKIKIKLAATLLGAMIFIWFVVLHVPRVMTAPSEYMASEIASACLALAYSGIAFMISGKYQDQKSS